MPSFGSSGQPEPGTGTT